MRTRVLAATLTAGVLLAACGGGSSATAPLPAATTAPSKQSSSKATFVVKIPPKRTSSARTPKYLTADVQGIQFSVTQSSGAVSAGGVFYALLPSEPYCTTPSGGGLTCTLEVNAAPGDDTFAVTTYDQPNNNYDPDVISVGSVEATISAQKSNTINIVTDGVPSMFVMSVDNQFPQSAGTQAVHLLALDADMNVIVGPYDTPVTLSDSDTTGAVTLSATSVASSTDASNLTVTWNGTALSNGPVLTAQTNSPLAAMYNNTNAGRVVIAPGGAGGIISSPSYLVFANSKDAAQTISLSAAGSGPAAPYTVDTNADAFGDWGVLINDDEAATWVHGCAGVVSVSGSSPAFTITPVHTGFCVLDVKDSGGHFGTVPLAVQSL